METQFCKHCKKTKEQMEFFRTVSHTPKRIETDLVKRTQIFKTCNKCSEYKIKRNDAESEKLKIRRIALREIGFYIFLEEDLPLYFNDGAIKEIQRHIHSGGWQDIKEIIKDEIEIQNLHFYNF